MKKRILLTLGTLCSLALLATHVHAIDVNAYQLDPDGVRIEPVASGSTQPSTIEGPDGSTASVVINEHTSNGELLVLAQGHVCSDNTTSTPLGAGGSFTGVWQNVINYGMAVISVNSDQASATDGMVVQWSPDATNVWNTDEYTIAAGAAKVFTYTPANSYLRIIYTNGGTPQGSFGLETIIKASSGPASSHRIQDAIVDEDDAELVKAVLTGENPAGTFVNFQSTTKGNFKMSLEELENDISVNANKQLKVTTLLTDGTESMPVDWLTQVRAGKITGASVVHKFGSNEAVANGVWEEISFLSTAAVHTPSASTVRIKAGGNAADTAAGLGAQSIIIQGIDTNLVEVSETLITAGASASAASTNTYWRVYRAWVSGVGTYAANNTAAITVEDTGGTNDLIIIPITHGQSQKARIMTPAGMTGYLLSALATVDSNNDADIRICTIEDITNVSAPFNAVRHKLDWAGIINPVYYNPKSPNVIIPALAEIWAEAEGAGAASKATMDMEILYLDNVIFGLD